jgi:ketosteroid isomerase-like protein/L-amino acid N-acyltransferase YncA
MATHPIGESKHPSVCVSSVLVPLTDRSAIAASGEVEPQLPAHYRVDRRPFIAAQSTVWTNLVRAYARSREVSTRAVHAVTEHAAKGQRSRRHSPGYAALVHGEVVIREAQANDARAIAEVNVASRRWSYRDLLTEADLDALSVEKTTADFAKGLAELPSGSVVFVAEWVGRVVGYAYVLPSSDTDIPAGTSELGSLYVTEDVAGTGVARALMEATVERARAAGDGLLRSVVRLMHPNEQLLRNEYRARADRDDRLLAEVLADDIAWHVPGKNLIAGEYRGRDQVMEYVRRRRALVDDTFEVTVEDVLANDEHGFVIASGSAVRDGKRLEWRAHGL